MSDILLRSLSTSTDVQVDAGGRRWDVHGESAREWIEACLSPRCPWTVFPWMVHDSERPAAVDLLALGDVDDVEARTAGFSAIKHASGRPWWEALRLVEIANDRDGFMLGRLVVSGVDPGRVSFASWCSAVYTLYTDGADPKELMKWQMKFKAPPSVPEAFDSEEDDFMSMIQAARSLPGMTR